MECTDSTKNIVKNIGPAIYPIFENAHGKAKLNYRRKDTTKTTTTKEEARKMK